MPLRRVRNFARKARGMRGRYTSPGDTTSHDLVERMYKERRAHRSALDMLTFSKFIESWPKESWCGGHGHAQSATRHTHCNRAMSHAGQKTDFLCARTPPKPLCHHIWDNKTSPTAKTRGPTGYREQRGWAVGGQPRRPGALPALNGAVPRHG